MTQRPVTRRPAPPRATTRRSAPVGGVRRTRPVRRASARLTPVRAGALLVALVSAAAIYGVANSAAFVYRDLQIDGAAVTDTDTIAAALDVRRGANLFQLRTGPLEAALRDLPTVAGATVSVRLPATVAVRLEERESILVWRVGARRYLVDPDGHLFALLGDHPPSSVASLPVVEDRRAASAGLGIGSTLDAVDLDAATRLASLLPGDVGSQGSRLDVIVSDASGFVVVGRPANWQAIFGFYTPSLRTPELIPGQVRLLRSLLIGREPTVDRIILASETDGTYTTRESPVPIGSGVTPATPSGSPAPSRAP